MVFIDLLTAQLFVLGFSGLVIIYATVQAGMLYKKGKEIEGHIRSAQVPLALLGFYAVVSGLFGQFTWPLPGSYNILYYDIFTLWGLFLLAGAWVLRSRLKLQYVGFLSLLIGSMSIWYGVNAYCLGLSMAPIAVLGLFCLFGLAGILGYPVTLMFDMEQERVKSKWRGWYVLLGLFILVLLLASALAIFVGASSVPAHLASPP
jgi:putative membrane protein